MFCTQRGFGYGRNVSRPGYCKTGVSTTIWIDHRNTLGILFRCLPAGRSGSLVHYMVSFAAPCDEFSHFADQSQHERLPADELKDILQFLNNGRRGYLLVLSEGQDVATVQPGDRVYVLKGKSSPISSRSGSIPSDPELITLRLHQSFDPNHSISVGWGFDFFRSFFSKIP
jgi:hypothetical protein